MTIRVAPGVGSFWDGFSSFFDPNVKTSEWIKANVWNWNTQPDYTPAKPPGAVVPDIRAYNNFNRWCSPTDTDCLNGITADPNVTDARRNMANYTAAQLAAIKQAEDEAAARDKQTDWQMWAALAVIGGGAVYILGSKKGRR